MNQEERQAAAAKKERQKQERAQRAAARAARAQQGQQAQQPQLPPAQQPPAPQLPAPQQPTQQQSEGHPQQAGAQDDAQNAQHDAEDAPESAPEDKPESAHIVLHEEQEPPDKQEQAEAPAQVEEPSVPIQTVDSGSDGTDKENKRLASAAQLDESASKRKKTNSGGHSPDHDAGAGNADAADSGAWGVGARGAGPGPALPYNAPEIPWPPQISDDRAANLADIARRALEHNAFRTFPGDREAEGPAGQADAQQPLPQSAQPSPGAGPSHHSQIAPAARTPSEQLPQPPQPLQPLPQPPRPVSNTPWFDRYGQLSREERFRKFCSVKMYLYNEGNVQAYREFGQYDEDFQRVVESDLPKYHGYPGWRSKLTHSLSERRWRLAQKNRRSVRSAISVLALPFDDPYRSNRPPRSMRPSDGDHKLRRVPQPKVHNYWAVMKKPLDEEGLDPAVQEKFRLKKRAVNRISKRVGPGLKYVKYLGSGGYGLVALFKTTNPDPQKQFSFVVKGANNPSESASDDYKKEKRMLHMFQGARHVVQPVFASDMQKGLDQGYPFENNPSKRLQHELDMDDELVLSEYMKLGSLQDLMEKLHTTNQRFTSRALWHILGCLVHMCVALQNPPSDNREHYKQLFQEETERRRQEDPNAPKSPRVTEQLLDGIKSDPVVHFDIDPQNILLTFDDGAHRVMPTLKLSDFGLAQVMDDDFWSTTYNAHRRRTAGKTGFLAPEQFNDEWDYYPGNLKTGPRPVFLHQEDEDKYEENRIGANFDSHTNVWQMGMVMMAAIFKETPPMPPVPVLHYIEPQIQSSANSHNSQSGCNGRSSSVGAEAGSSKNAGPDTRQGSQGGGGSFGSFYHGSQPGNPAASQDDGLSTSSSGSSLTPPPDSEDDSQPDNHDNLAEAQEPENDSGSPHYVPVSPHYAPSPSPDYWPRHNPDSASSDSNAGNAGTTAGMAGNPPAAVDNNHPHPRFSAATGHGWLWTYASLLVHEQTKVDWVDQGLRDIICRMLAHRPSDRISLKSLLVVVDSVLKNGTILVENDADTGVHRDMEFYEDEFQKHWIRLLYAGIPELGHAYTEGRPNTPYPEVVRSREEA